MARKMKDSGIEWIGEIPEGWEVAPLKRFASIQTGNTPTKTSDSNYYASTGIPWIKPDNLGYSHSISKTSEYLTSEGALCARIMPQIRFMCVVSEVLEKLAILPYHVLVISKSMRLFLTI